MLIGMVNPNLSSRGLIAGCDVYNTLIVFDIGERYAVKKHTFRKRCAFGAIIIKY